MLTVDALKEKSQSVNYTYLKILQKYRFDSKEMHYVFEGYDDQSFYFNFLQPISQDYVTYISKGKKQSLELYQKLDWVKYDKKRIIIFIDQDYCRILGDQVPSDENIYETTYYSIENYISDISILRRLINEILHYHEEANVLSIITKYQEQIDVFSKLIQPIISWILITRSHNLKVNLNNIDMSKLFQITPSLDVMEIKLDRIEYLEKVTNIKTPKVYYSAFKSWYLIFHNLPSYKLYLRGKYEMWFLVSFFNKLNDYLKATFGHESKIKTNITYTNAIEIIGPRTSIPNRLNDFLNNISK